MTDHEKEFVDKLLDAGLQRYSAVDRPPGLEDRLLTALKVARMSEEPVGKLLDAGLQRYSAVDPPPGLENRLLAGLPAQPQPSPWLDWRWAGALAAAAAAVVLVIFFFRQPPPPETPPQTASTPAPVAPPVAQPPQTAKAAVHRTPRPVRPARVESARAEAPRLETFPAPAPLSEQERLLLFFTRQAPQEAVLMAQARNRPTEPLGVTPLQPIEELVKKAEEDNH